LRLGGHERRREDDGFDGRIQDEENEESVTSKDIKGKISAPSEEKKIEARVDSTEQEAPARVKEQAGKSTLIL